MTEKQNNEILKLLQNLNTLVENNILPKKTVTESTKLFSDLTTESLTLLKLLNSMATLLRDLVSNDKIPFKIRLKIVDVIDEFSAVIKTL
jgi:uncharacterized protein (UPF0147 family)